MLGSYLPQNIQLCALNLLIRFYISIEDGACPVERDLAALGHPERADVDHDKADDLVLLASDPIEVADMS